MLTKAHKAEAKARSRSNSTSKARAKASQLVIPSSQPDEEEPREELEILDTSDLRASDFAAPLEEFEDEFYQERWDDDDDGSIGIASASAKSAQRSIAWRAPKDRLEIVIEDSEDDTMVL